MNEDPGSARKLAALQRSFDEPFAAPLPPQAADLEPILLIRVAGEPLALRSLQIAGLVKIGRILPVPSRIKELLGITAVRGTIVPVFDLAVLLGFPFEVVQPGWLALTRGEPLTALAFEEIEGRAEIPSASLYKASPARDCIQHLVHMESVVRPVADVPPIVEAIRRRAGVISSDKE